MYIAAKDKDTTYIGMAQSEYLSASKFTWSAASDLLLPENVPIWKVVGHPGVMMAADKGGIVQDTLRRKASLFEGELTSTNVIRQVLQYIYDTNERFGQLSDKKRCNGGYVLADADHIINIDLNMYVTEADYAASDFDDLVDGIFAATEGKSAEERILTAFRLISDCLFDSIFPVAIYDVKTGKRKIYKQ